MRAIDKIINILFLIVLAVLVVFSFIAIILLHFKLVQSGYSFSLSPEGIDTYLSSYGDYRALFIGTVTVIAGYYGLHRMTVAADANLQKVKQDKFTEWKTILDVRFAEIDKSDPYMQREFIRVRYKFYEHLFNLSFNIDDQKQLKEVFENVFKDLVLFFEIYNNRHSDMGGIYRDDQHSYSFENFRFLFLGCLDNYYQDIVVDLKKLYLSNMRSDRDIDPSLYESSIKLLGIPKFK